MELALILTALFILAFLALVRYSFYSQGVFGWDPCNTLYVHIIVFHNVFMQRKAGYIKRVAEILLKDYDSDIPSTFEELVSLRIYWHVRKINSTYYIYTAFIAKAVPLHMLFEETILVPRL